MVEIVRQTFIKGFFISTVLPSDNHGLYETNETLIIWENMEIDING